MNHTSQIRRWIKWCVVLLAFGLLVSAWLVSRYSVVWLQGHGWLVWLDAGAVKVQYASHRAEETWRVWSFSRKADFTNWWVQIQGSPGILVVPIWLLMLPILIVALTTCYRFWLDRRRIPPGHCRKCGYNLTGNMSGVCPECGEKT